MIVATHLALEDDDVRVVIVCERRQAAVLAIEADIAANEYDDVEDDGDGEKSCCGGLIRYQIHDWSPR